MTHSGPPGPAAQAPALPTRRALRAQRMTGSVRTAPIRPARRARRNGPLTVAVAFLAIPGLVLTAALPAYAFRPGAEAAPVQSFSAAEAQDVTVDAAAASLTIARDGFTATSAAELAQRAAAAARSVAAERAAEAARSRAAQYAVSGIRAEGDDYPWAFEATGVLSPLGYYNRECVDFVSWRLNRDAGSSSSAWTWTWDTLTPGGGNASSWNNAWVSAGRVTSSVPVVGAVAWFRYNHVAYVQAVPGDGTVVLEEYNWMGSHAYHTRTIPVGAVPRYLYPPG